jgi:hypothetical protein
MKLQRIIIGAFSVVLASAVLSFAGDPASPGGAQQSGTSVMGASNGQSVYMGQGDVSNPCLCQCQQILRACGAMDNMPTGASPSVTTTKKRTVDEVNWDQVFGVTG